MKKVLTGCVATGSEQEKDAVYTEAISSPDLTQRLANPHPGETIREGFLEPWGMTPYRLAKGTGMSPTRVSQILRGKRGITAETALRLAAFLGGSPQFWLNLQAAYDLEEARLKLSDELAGITRYEHQGLINLDGELVDPEPEGNPASEQPAFKRPAG
jgi:antitoxin HigA-1